MSLPINTVITGDCIEVMKTFPENSIDCIVTDPPYGLSNVSPKETTEKINRVLLQILFPYLNNPDAKTLEETYLSGIPLDGSLLSYMKVLRIIYPGIGVPPSTINFNNLVGSWKEKVSNTPKPSLSIPERILSLESDIHGGKCLGNYVLDLGIGFGKFATSDLFCSGFTHFSPNQITIFVSPIFASCDPNFLADLLVIWGINNNIRFSNDSLSGANASSNILTSSRTIDTFMLTFDLARKTIEFLPTNRTNTFDLGFSFFDFPHLIGAMPRTGSLSTPSKSLRISVIDPTTNRASPFYFNLVCQIDNSIVDPNIYFMEKLSDSYPKGGFMGKIWDKALPPKQAFVEMCRVLKPGALAFVMSSPRQDLMWRMGQLLEESGFELSQSFISWIYACLSDDTKLLTEDGLKSYNEISGSEFIYSFDIENNCLVKEKFDNVYIYKHVGKMFHLFNQNTNQLMTLNHKIIHKEKHHSGSQYWWNDWQYKEAQELKLHTAIKLPISAKYNGTESIGLDLVRLLGWIITEGHYYEKE